MKTKNKFFGSNGKKGVTVYKPMDVITIGDGFGKIYSNQKNKTKFVKDGVEYKITKKNVDDSNIKKFLSNKNTILTFSERKLMWKSSKELKSKDYRLLRNIIVYKIKRVNKNGKVFKFNLIGTNIGVVVNGLLIKNKIKMRMF